MYNVAMIRALIEEKRIRSAWDRAVKEYALELLEDVTDDDTANERMLKKALLNGAVDWKQYSWGGCSLIYDAEIAARCCTPSELKRTHNGERRPNKGEEWLDVQARALYQAAVLILRIARRDEEATGA